MFNIIILLLFLAAAFVQYRILLKQRIIRDIVVSSSFLAVGILLVLLKQFEVPLPSPMIGIDRLLKPVESFVSKMLK